MQRPSSLFSLSNFVVQHVPVAIGQMYSSNSSNSSSSSKGIVWIFEAAFEQEVENRN